MTLQVLKTKALRLPVNERADLAAELLSSLDSGDPATNEQLWLDEAERRYEAYRRDKSQGIPADQAFRRLRARLA
jgi:putative addiction module component (TIGR02574 family)